MKRGLVIACLLFVAACGGGGEPDVDWSAIPSYQRVGIDDAIASGDCDQMQTVFDGSDEADVLDYINWHMEKAGCYN